MEVVWILAIVVVLFPQALLTGYSWMYWPKRRTPRMTAWQLRIAGLIVFAVTLGLTWLKR